MRSFKKQILQISEDTLPLTAFYYRATYPGDCYVGAAPHHPETEAWVIYIDENGVEQTFNDFCAGEGQPGIGAGCVEIMANSIVNTNQVTICVP